MEEPICSVCNSDIVTPTNRHKSRPKMFLKSLVSTARLYADNELGLTMEQIFLWM